MSAPCQRFAVRRKTGHKWLARRQGEGLTGSITALLGLDLAVPDPQHAELSGHDTGASAATMARAEGGAIRAKHRRTTQTRRQLRFRSV